MKTAIIIAILAASFQVAPAFAGIGVGLGCGPGVKCHPKCCGGGVGSIPVESGKGSCKAHPASCK